MSPFAILVAVASTSPSGRTMDRTKNKPLHTVKASTSTPRPTQMATVRHHRPSTRVRLVTIRMAAMLACRVGHKHRNGHDPLALGCREDSRPYPVGGRQRTAIVGAVCQVMVHGAAAGRKMTPCASSSINSNLSFSSNCSTTRRRHWRGFRRWLRCPPPCPWPAGGPRRGKTIFHRALDTAVEVVVAVVQEQSLRQHEPPAP